MTANFWVLTAPRSQGSCMVSLYPESHQRGQMFCPPPKLPGFTAGIPRTGMERGAGAFQQAQRPAKLGRAHHSDGKHRSWWDAYGIISTRAGVSKKQDPVGTNRVKASGPACCREGPGVAGRVVMLRASAAHLQAPDLIL